MPSSSRATIAWLAIGVVTAIAVGCSGQRPPAQPPGQTVVEPTPATEDTTPPPPAPPSPELRPRTELRPPKPQVVIEPTGPEPGTAPTLAEAALRERQRRQSSGEPIAVINDANLRDHAVGQLTFLADDEEETSPDDENAEDGGEEGPDEQYWRDRVRGIRQRWADAAAQLPQLEERVEVLRRQFYETDDAYYRDSRIKPAWDRAIDLIAQNQAEAETHRRELDAALEEGRLAGALPGWLREGLELEPGPPAPKQNIHEPGEPVIVEPVEGPQP